MTDLEHVDADDLKSHGKFKTATNVEAAAGFLSSVALAKFTTEDVWDVFLSYRVNSDKDLVKELYWMLRGKEVRVQGKTRKLRVFWDIECLKSGEKWEDGFCKAICKSAVIVPVMSERALTTDAKVSWNKLEERSPCDNVLLEFQLALALVDIHQYQTHPVAVPVSLAPSVRSAVVDADLLSVRTSLSLCILSYPASGAVRCCRVLIGPVARETFIACDIAFDGRPK